eukprot:CAMPEP_0184738874 /NCGR_PEP_ID=MMETSP0315-20130426/1623_1 /TAXON_ID=101924 /ORGANISM="Rhodosorus marinus, Strain UTEX LB 2760" /LENGTH=223 /DNA_ID=CAMNT_0027207049 /DNA_START=142 /DNA_END=813 /DNA_ORIENTATION=-
MDSAKGKKRTLERKRRELMHTRFDELQALLFSSSAGSEEVGNRAHGRRSDKEKILVRASEKIQRQARLLEEIEGMIALTKKELDTLKNEKLELRNDKTYLRNEIHQLREENRGFRADNLWLWQKHKKDYEMKIGLNGENSSKGDIDMLSNLQPGDHSAESTKSSFLVNHQGTSTEKKTDGFDARSLFAGHHGKLDEEDFGVAADETMDPSQGTLLSELVLAIH